MTVQRGHLYRVMTGQDSAVLCLVISNNAHNAREDICTAVLVSADRDVPAGLPSWVRLHAGDPGFGHVVCSHLGPFSREELKEDLGEMSQETMMNVGRALKNMLGL